MSTTEHDDLAGALKAAMDAFGWKGAAKLETLIALLQAQAATIERLSDALRDAGEAIHAEYCTSAKCQPPCLTVTVALEALATGAKEFHGGERGGGKSERLARPPSWRDVEDRSFVEPALYEALTMLRAGLLTREQALIHAVLRLSLERERLHALAVEMRASQQGNKLTS